MATTLLDDLINPEVMAPFMAKKMVDNMVFAPIARVSTELVGVAGNTVTIPAWKYIGEAKDVAENVSDVPVKMEAITKQVTVKKVVRSVEFTDEALLSAEGNLQGEIEKQLSISIAEKVDNDVLTALRTLTPVADVKVGEKIDWVADALATFGEDMNEEVYLFINPKNYASIRKDPDFVYIQNGMAKVNGQIGQIFGAQVVVSNKVKAGEAFLVKSNAIGIELKRQLNVESGRDVLRSASVIKADRHYVAYVYDDSRVAYIAATTTP